MFVWMLALAPLACRELVLLLRSIRKLPVMKVWWHNFNFFFWFTRDLHTRNTHTLGTSCQCFSRAVYSTAGLPLHSRTVHRAGSEGLVLWRMFNENISFLRWHPVPVSRQYMKHTTHCGERNCRKSSKHTPSPVCAALQWFQTQFLPSSCISCSVSALPVLLYVRGSFSHGEREKVGRFFATSSCKFYFSVRRGGEKQK